MKKWFIIIGVCLSFWQAKGQHTVLSASPGTSIESEDETVDVSITYSFPNDYGTESGGEASEPYYVVYLVELLIKKDGAVIYDWDHTGNLHEEIFDSELDNPGVYTYAFHVDYAEYWPSGNSYAYFSETPSITVTVTEPPPSPPDPEEDCYDGLVITSILQDEDFRAQYIIESSATITNNINVHFGAQVIKLISPFSVTAGSTFLADHNGCTPTKNATGKEHASSILNTTSNLIIYPNPTSGILNVEIPISDDQTKIIRVSTVTGVLMHEETFDGSSAKIDLSNLKRGSYILDVGYQNGVSHKIVVLE
jgi:hypothetical protein